ncbi:MAG: hypothetical protein J07HQX50_02320 [Haloquadratum sp. J07HQX50]|nr:MAG: hypothetical protein J07HQX50_02320 [Haloquadratum sp. J07HQX50]
MMALNNFLTELKKTKEVNQTNISEIEAKIDEAVHDLFNLTDDEREIIEDYLEAL